MIFGYSKLLSKKKCIFEGESIMARTQTLQLHKFKLIALILYFQSLSWPSEAIKLLFAYFNHLIKAKSSLYFNMRTIQKFVSVE